MSISLEAKCEFDRRISRITYSRWFRTKVKTHRRSMHQRPRGGLEPPTCSGTALRSDYLILITGRVCQSAVGFNCDELQALLRRRSGKFSSDRRAIAVPQRSRWSRTVIAAIMLKRRTRHELSSFCKLDASWCRYNCNSIIYSYFIERCYIPKKFINYD